MSFDREEQKSKHQQHIQTILQCDMDELKQKEINGKHIQENIKACKTRIGELRIAINRISYLEQAIDNLLTENKLTQTQKDILITYIKELPVEDQKNTMTGILTAVQFKSFAQKNNFARHQNPALMTEILGIGKAIDQVEHALTLSSLPEHHKNEYQEKLSQISNGLILINQNEADIENALTIFIAENIANSDELNTISHHTDNKKTEVLVIPPDEIDLDLATVIHMRAKNSHEKEDTFIMMSFEQFNEIMHDNQLVHEVTKLSFLHHGVDEFGYVSEIENYINHLPDLEEIVLRGCGTANEPTGKPTLYVVKMSNTPYDQKAPIQGNESLVVQQKEDESGEIMTKVSWMAENTRHEIQNITGIPKIAKNKPSDEELKSLEHIKGLPLLKHSNTYISSVRATFFNPDKAISTADKFQAKKVLRRARTESAVSSEGDLLSEVLDNMNAEQKAKVSVKAYIGGYEVRQQRILPSQAHGYGNAPKALRIGPKK